MDLDFGPEQDIMSDAGFCNMMYQALTVTPGSNLWCAPVCSTWVFLTLGLINETFSSLGEDVYLHAYASGDVPIDAMATLEDIQM